MSIEFVFLSAFLGFFLLWRARQEVSRHEVITREVNLPKLRALTDRISILHLSDIHFAFPDPALEKFFDRLARMTFDFIFVTGDIIDCPEGVSVCAANLSKLKSLQGGFAVLGNHDYYDYNFFDVLVHSREGRDLPKKENDWQGLERALKGAGFRVLKNETVEASAGGFPLLIHGLDDPVSGRASIRKTLARYDPEKLNILLAHTVDVFLDIEEGEIDLSFSGHLHGGQVCLPVIGPIVVPTVFGRKYTSGMPRLKGAHCSISRGIGTSRNFRYRLFCPPEAIVVEVGGEKT